VGVEVGGGVLLPTGGDEDDGDADDDGATDDDDATDDEDDDGLGAAACVGAALTGTM
jgi:hypothetical protein